MYPHLVCRAEQEEDEEEEEEQKTDVESVHQELGMSVNGASERDREIESE